MNQHARQWLQGLARAGKPDELEVKQLLGRYGIGVPRGVRVRPGDEAAVGGGSTSSASVGAELAEPLVVKVCSSEVLHKTDRGGVVLGVGRDQLAAVVSQVQARFPGEDLLVEEQVQMQGPELIIGALVDPDFGPAVMVGAGGILTELYRDVTFRLAPCTPADAGAMLRELTIAPLFEGFRGITLDAGGLAAVICAAGRLAVDLGEAFSQLDINPIASVAGRWTALDAKLVLALGT